MSVFRTLAFAALSAGLGGCVSLLPKSDPAQLYTFGRGDAGATAPAAPVAGPRAGVLLAAVTFPRAATGDQILTMTGTEAAYIAESRWIGPASVLFREAVERRFETAAQRSRLIARGDIGFSSLILRLDVRAFEASYPNGPETIPTVTVNVRARLTAADGRFLDERSFVQQRPATENRVSTIVAAFDQATTEALDGVVAWVDQTAAAQTAPASAAPRNASPPQR